MAILDYVFAAIPMLGILIFVHELGHFIVAKACGVRVLKFSIGFGPAVGFGSHRLRWERAGTEYVIAWFPLGGFVRMLGEQLPGDEQSGAPVPEDARPDEFLDAKPSWQKIAIVTAGPAMNLLLPVLIFMAMLWSGIPKTASVVGMVERESPAERAGIRPGDRLTALDGVQVEWWEEVSERVRNGTGDSIAIEIDREGEALEFEVARQTRKGLDEFGSSAPIGWVGLSSQRASALVGIPDGASPAAGAGLRSGDLIQTLDGAEIEDWAHFERAYEAAAPPSGEVTLGLARGPDPEHIEELSITVPALHDVEALGVLPATILVAGVVEGTPADRAGLEVGDLILAVDGRPVGSFFSFAETVRASEGRTLEIAYARDGEVVRVPITPVRREVPGPFGIEGMEEEVYQIGVAHSLAALPGVTGLDRERNPLVSIPRSVAMTIEHTRSLLRGLGMLATGELGADQLRGPITIAQIARKSLDLGWQAYLITMIFISINLGILNLLPIPILDGGQLVIHVIEAVKRSPISLRAREMVQQVGFVVLMLLMGLAFWNDLSGQWVKFVQWLSPAS